MPDLRLDVAIEIAGGLLWLAPTTLGGLSPEEFSASWMGDPNTETTQQLVERGVFIPLSLYQDDGYVVRVVLGDLTAEEQQNWTARAVGMLHLPEGELVISGVLTPELESELAMMGPATDGESVELGMTVAVPPGSYEVEVLALPPGDLSSGWGQMTNKRAFGSLPGLKKEAPLDYFRRTRPSEEPPAWMTEDDDDGHLFVDFVVRLIPMGAPPALIFSQDEPSLQWEFRKPDVCPIGVRSRISQE